MEERKDLVTFKGEPLTLQGSPVEVGQEAPDFKVISNDLQEKTLGDFKGNVCVIAAVPSLDTSVCSTEAGKFNKEAENLPEDVKVLTISMDLPFAQQRWCGQENAENVITLSDHKYADFGEKYGILIKELRLLARTVFIIDKEGKVQYKQLVKEVAEEPDYDEVMAELKKLM